LYVHSERNRFALLIVFGAEERTQAEAILDSLSTRTKKVYDEATTYHDGKWVLLTINSSEVVEDVMKLLEIKRKPKKRKGA
jgi:predicted RNA-binding protein with PUA-like domain